MSEVTRIACPGCRSPLRFEPEALDFPANCGACNCRFTAAIYVRIACPKCRSRSKIRESYRDRRVRCVRCRHDFLADDGIPPGAGGRLLVARMLDTGLPEPPQTIQPFLGHARAEAGSKLASPEGRDGHGAGRIKAGAIAERDRLAEKDGIVEAFQAREVSAARQAAEEAEGRARSAEESLALAILEHQDEVRRMTGMLDLRGEAPGTSGRERSALSTKIDRLNLAILSARAGEGEALGRLEELAGRLRDAEARAVAERRRTLELGKVVDELSAEVESTRKAVAARALQADVELASGRRKAFELGQLVDELRAEVEVAREALASRSSAHEAELVGRSKGFEEARQGLVAELERARSEAEQAASLARDEVARAGQQLDAATALAEQSRAAVIQAEARHRAELGNLAALLAERENARIVALEENRSLAAGLKRLRAEAEGPLAENERLAEAVDRLLDQNQRLNEAAERLRAENRRLAAEVKAAKASRQVDQGAPASAEMVEVKAEAERRRKALVKEIRRLEKEYEKLAARSAGEVVPHPPPEEAPSAGPGRPPEGVQAPSRDLERSAAGPLLSMSFASPSDVWEPPGLIVAGCAETESQTVVDREVDLHRDLPVTMLYGEKSDDDRPAVPGGR